MGNNCESYYAGTDAGYETDVMAAQTDTGYESSGRHEDKKERSGKKKDQTKKEETKVDKGETRTAIDIYEDDRAQPGKSPTQEIVQAIQQPDGGQGELTHF